MNIAHRVQQLRHLLLTRLDDPPIRMTGGGNSKCGCQIEVFFSIRVPNVNAPRALPNNRPRAVRSDERDVARFVVAEKLKNFLGSRHAQKSLTTNRRE